MASTCYSEFSPRVDNVSCRRAFFRYRSSPCYMNYSLLRCRFGVYGFVSTSRCGELTNRQVKVTNCWYLYGGTTPQRNPERNGLSFDHEDSDLRRYVTVKAFSRFFFISHLQIFVKCKYLTFCMWSLI